MMDKKGMMLPEEAQTYTTAPETESGFSGIKGDFTPGTVALLVRNLNKLLPLFDIPVIPPAMTKKMSNELPAPLVEAIAMVASAAEDAQDAGIDVTKIDLGAVETGSDTELGVVALALGDLVANRQFNRWLKSEQGD